MSLLWINWSDQWLLESKVTFDGFNKLIIVNPEVADLNIRTDVYSAWVRWLGISLENSKWLPAIRYSGMDPIPGGETGGTFFLFNNWKLIIDLNHVKISGVLYSEDFPTAYWSSSGLPMYPATVSALVNSSIVTQNIVTGTVPSLQSIADQIRLELAIELARIDKTISSRATPADIAALT